jgi:hypothetical protein
MSVRPHVRLGTAVAAVMLGSTPAWAQTTFLDVQHRTGGDDLRGGNSAYVSMILRDGTVVPERPLVSGPGGLPGGASRATLVRFSRVATSADQVATFRIRHDGNPRSGHPFDTYDNWDLRSMRIVVRTSSGCVEAYRSPADTTLLHRFTGESRTLDLPAGRLRSVACR